SELLDPRGSVGESLLVEQERRRVRDRVDGPVQIVRAAGRVERVADWNFVTHDQHLLVWTLEQLAVGLPVPTGGVVEAFGARKALGARPPAFPVAVLVDRPALELADLDVVEERLLHERKIASFEGDMPGFERPSETRVHAGVDRLAAELQAEQRRVFAA